MTLDREKICNALDCIATTAPNTVINLNKISSLSHDELNILFCMLTLIGVAKEQDGNYILSSESASLCIKSLSEFTKQGDVLIPVWEDRVHNPSEINKHNALTSANFLYLMEHAREKIGRNRGQLTPLRIETIVRVAIIRKIWGRKYYLMQYDDRVGKYQLIGGRVLSGDSTNEEALARKIREELPAIVEYIRECTPPRCVFVSERSDEEIFLSEKFGVLVQYKTFIYEIHLKEVQKDLLKKISGNRANRWVSIKEIEKTRAHDGKGIFQLAPTAISALKELNPTIKIAQYDVALLLEMTWLKIILAVAGIAGLLPLLKWFASFFFNF